MFENSKWIGCVSKHPGTDVANTPAPYLARSFTLREKPAKATLNVCGIGDAAYYINGARIPGVIRPTYASDLPKTVIYNVIDVTDLLTAGKNRFGAILGNFRINSGNFAFQSGLKLIAELDIVYADGASEVIVSDESFNGMDSPLIFSSTVCGERQDARLEIPGWCDKDFDDSGWDNAVEVEAPGGKLRTTTIPPKKITAEKPFSEIAPRLFDCFDTTSGYARMKITGKAGTLIKLNYSERLTPDGQHVDRSAYTKWNYPDMYNSDEYILDGTPGKVFDQYMAFHGFRYVEVVGDYDEIELTAVTEHTDLKDTARFECDNEIINRIHNACLNSVRTCCQDVFVDNPKRDAPWIGDTMLSSEVIISEFDGNDTLIENARLCRDNMNDAGLIPYCVPAAAGWCYSKRFSGPDWGNSVVFQTVYWIYKYTGDLGPFREFRGDLERSLGFFRSIADEDGYIGDGGYATGDWSSLHSRREARQDIMSNVYYKWDAEIMAELSALCGYDRSEYDKLAERIKTAFRKRYMQNGSFEEICPSELITLAARGFFNEDEMPGIMNRIAESFRKENMLITFGVHGIKMMSELMCEHGLGELLFDVIVNADGPGYAKNVKDGLTGLSERFDYAEDGIFSLNHHFFCMVDTFFYRRLAGIMVNDFASGDIVISPLFVKGINRLSAEFRGIKVGYDEKELRISSPYAFRFGKDKLLPAGEYTFNR